MPDYERLRAERAMVEAGARALRSRAIADGYRGLGRKEVAFALALVLDELAAHLRQLSDDIRGAALEYCETLTARPPH